jgi:heptosyltransferase-1
MSEQAIAPGAPLPSLANVERLLIIRLSSIGDVVHAIPVSAAIGEAYPHIKMTWLIEEMSAPIVEGNPYVHETIVIPRARWKKERLRSPAVWREYLAFLANLRRQRFDLSLDLHGFAKSGLYALGAQARYRYGWWWLREGSALASRSIPHRPESLHRVEWFLDVPRAFGIQPGKVKFPLHIPDTAYAAAQSLRSSFGIEPGGKFVIMNPAAGDRPRRWGAQRYADLAVAIHRRFYLPTVLIGSGKDVRICDRIIELASAGGCSAVYNAAGKTDLKVLAALLSTCTLQICGDTGSAHIGSAVGTPTIGLYGPTDPAHAGPWGQLDKVVVAGVRCNAGCGNLCSRIEAPAALTDYPEDRAITGCMESITVEQVMSRVERTL